MAHHTRPESSSDPTGKPVLPGYVTVSSLPQTASIRSRTARAVAVAAVSLICLHAGAQDLRRELEIVAAQVRKQGFSCQNPNAVESIESDSTPHQRVYVLKCEGMVYRVHLVPDRAAKVHEIK